MPLTPAGLALVMAPMKACTLSTSASSVKLALPTPAWTMPAFSARNSTWPPLAALTASADVGRDGAELRVRHQAARAQHFAEPADDRHHVGRGDAAVEIDLPRLHLLRQIFGADDVGARRPAPPRRLVALGEDGDA